MEAKQFILSNQGLIVSGLWLFLVLSLICTAIMLVVFLKGGDEREKHVMSKSARIALIVAIIFLITSVIWKVFFEANSRFGFESSPIIYLGIISIAFNISYFINSKNYG